jgi:hypothetical protein
VNNAMAAKVPLDRERYYSHITIHMRPFVHHWSSLGVPPDTREGVYDSPSCVQDSRSEDGFGGGQNLIYDNPPHGEAAPENEGIVRVISSNSAQCLNTMAYNLTPKPQLREAWVNIYFTDKPKEVQEIGSIHLLGGRGLNLPPGQKRELTYQTTFNGDGRIIQLFGTRMMHTTRLAAWLNDELIYDSYDWQAAVTFNYDSITKNPKPDPNHQKDGAASGILPFKKGDFIKYSCFIENATSQVLRFKNSLDGGEMCNLWGITVGESASGDFP